MRFRAGSAPLPAAGARFVVLRDQDSAPCETVKERLRAMCADAGRRDTLIRIPCRELEAWYLGDLAAVDAGLGTRDLAALQGRRKYRTPDRFDICEDCGDKISFERMDALPHTTMCIRCKEKEEKSGLVETKACFF